jgi:galactonate dehydratase
MMLTRRTFAAIPLALHAASATIDSVEAFSIPVNHRGDWLLFRVRTSNGATGIGDASHGGSTKAKLPILKEMFGSLRAQPVADIVRLHRTVEPTIRRLGTPAAIVWSGIEQCLWDLIGQAAGAPVYALFGGKLRDTLHQYANINRSTLDRTPSGFAEQAKRAVKDGFSAIKMAPWDGMPKGPDEAIAKHTANGIAAIAAVREVIGTDRALLADGHGYFTRQGSMDLARRLEQFNLYWLEETCPSDDIASLAAVNAAVKMTTAGGEASYGIAAFGRMIEAKAFDILMPDIKYCGGLLECTRIAAAADAAGLKVAPHGPASPVGNIAAAHVCAGMPNFDILEYAHGEAPWRAEVIQPAESLTNGDLRVPEMPGLGIKLNDALLKARATRVS